MQVVLGVCAVMGVNIASLFPKYSKRLPSFSYLKETARRPLLPDDVKLAAVKWAHPSSICLWQHLPWRPQIVPRSECTQWIDRYSDSEGKCTLMSYLSMNYDTYHTHQLNVESVCQLLDQNQVLPPAPQLWPVFTWSKIFFSFCHQIFRCAWAV